MNLQNHYRQLVCSLPVIALFLSACAGTKRLEITDTFPVPLMEKVPVSLGIHLDEKLTNYIHKETIERKGSWEVSVGAAQQSLFNTLAKGLFESHTFVEGVTVEKPFDGVLKPSIQEVQFSLPAQTRSDYYEVWIRYHFELFDRAGTLVGDWKLPAYGKANKNDYGSSSKGLRAATIAACRDAMAFFSLNFDREPDIQSWIAAGKPLMPSAVTPSPVTTSQSPTTTSTTPSTPQSTGNTALSSAEEIGHNNGDKE